MPRKSTYSSQPFDRDDPLAPMEGETVRAIEALHQYVALGPARSLEELRRKTGKSSDRYLQHWSSRWRWQDRISAWVRTVGRANTERIAEMQAQESFAAIQQLKRIAAEAFAAWEASKAPRRRTIEEAALQKGGGEGGRAKRTVVTVESVGDPHMLIAAIKANDSLRRALGTDAAAKVELDYGERTLGSATDMAVALSKAASEVGGVAALRDLQTQLQRGIEKK
jgi:hypothetical protein